MAVGWKVKPQLGRNRRRQAPRLGSVETWRSDLIVESSSQVKSARSHELSPPGALSKSRGQSPKPKVLLNVAQDLGKELSVIGFKPLASSPVFSQLPGANLAKRGPGSSTHRENTDVSNPKFAGSLSRSASKDSLKGMIGGFSIRNASKTNGPEPLSLNAQGLGIGLNQTKATARRMSTKYPASMTQSAPAPLSIPVPAPIEIPTDSEWPAAPTVSREVLSGKLMEIDALIRRKFDTRDELCSLQESVESCLQLLSQLQLLAVEANVLEGVLFQDLLQRLATGDSPPARPAAPASISPPNPSAGVTRTPIPGAEREHWQSAQMVGGLFANKPQILPQLLAQVAALKGLLRIKIEDNKDLELARRALGEVKCAIDNLWWYAEAKPEVSAGGLDCAGAVVDKLGVTGLLRELRA